MRSLWYNPGAHRHPFAAALNHMGDRMNAFEPSRPLSPLNVIGIIGASVGVLFRNLVALIGIPLLMLAGVLVAVSAVMVPLVLGGRVIPGMLASSAEWPLGMALAILIGVLVLLAIPFLVLWVTVCMGALVGAMGGGHLGLRLGIGEAFGVGMRRALPLLGATILSKLIVIFVTMPAMFLFMASGLLLVQGQAARDAQLQLLAVPFLCITPFLVAVAIYVSLRLLFVPFTAVFEEVGPIGAVERSWAVSRGHVLRLAGYLLLISLIVGGITVLLQLLMQPAMTSLSRGLAFAALTDSRAWATPAGAMAQMGSVALPLLAVTAFFAVIALVSLAEQIVYVVLYFDIRHRDEGFGAAAEALEPIPPPDGAEPPGEPEASEEPVPADEPEAVPAAEGEPEGDDGAPVAEAAVAVAAVEAVSDDADQVVGEESAVGEVAVAAGVVAAATDEDPAESVETPVADDADAFAAAAAVDAAAEDADSPEAAQAPQAEVPEAATPAVAPVDEPAPAEPPAWASLPIESEGAGAGPEETPPG